MNGVVILPNHNDCNCLLKLIPRIETELQKRANDSWRIVVVDDASTTPPPDGWNLLNVTLLRLASNQGHQGAIFQGLQWCVVHLVDVGRFVVTIAYLSAVSYALYLVNLGLIATPMRRVLSDWGCISRPV